MRLEFANDRISAEVAPAARPQGQPAGRPAAVPRSYHAGRDRSRTRGARIGTLTPLEWVGRAILAAADKKARDIVVIDVGDLLAITDHFVICSAASDRQVRTIADEVERKLREDDRRPLRTEGAAETGWILVDYGDFVVHVFSDEMREYYELERLWKDAPRPQLPELVEARRDATG